MNPAVTFSLVYLLAAAIALAAVAVIWPRRTAPGGTPLALMLLAAAFWAICDAIELHVPTVERQAPRLPVAVHRRRSPRRPVSSTPRWRCRDEPRRLTPLAAAPRSGRVPLASLMIAWTNPWHRWLWTGILLPTGDAAFAIYQYGWWFWVLTAQHYLLMVAATILLLDAIRRVRRPFRTGMTAVLVAVVLPWIGNAAYNAKLGPWPGLNWLTLSLGISGSLLVWVVLREGLLDLLPRAREALLDKMTDGVLVLDRDGRVIIRQRSAHARWQLDGTTLATALGLASLRDAPEQWRTEAQVDTRRRAAVARRAHRSGSRSLGRARRPARRGARRHLPEGARGRARAPDRRAAGRAAARSSSSKGCCRSARAAGRCATTAGTGGTSRSTSRAARRSSSPTGSAPSASRSSTRR